MRDMIPLIVAACSLVGVLYSVTASRKATRVSQETNQIKWVEDARREAHAAKKEADEVKEDLVTTRREVLSTRREAQELHDLVDELTRWTMRVVNWAQDDTVGYDELRRLINGGPPSLRNRIGP
jgi:hypothetical protein